MIAVKMLLRKAPRRRGAVLAIAVVGLVVLAVSLLANAAADTHHGRRAPSLSLVSRSPVTVSGRAFRPRTRVHVQLSAGRTFSRRPMASRAGTFTTTFPTVIDRCTSWSVSARQKHGALVVLRGAKPECAPASVP